MDLVAFIVATLARVEVIADALQDGDERKGFGADEIRRVTHQPQAEEMLNYYVRQSNHPGNDVKMIFSIICC